MTQSAGNTESKVLRSKGVKKLHTRFESSEDTKKSITDLSDDDPDVLIMASLPTPIASEKNYVIPLEEVADEAQYRRKSRLL